MKRQMREFLKLSGKFRKNLNKLRKTFGKILKKFINFLKKCRKLFKINCFEVERNVTEKFQKNLKSNLARLSGFFFLTLD